MLWSRVRARTVPPDVARLEKADRRYTWIKRQMKSNEEVWMIFPEAWRLQEMLCQQFCKITRQALSPYNSLL